MGKTNRFKASVGHKPSIQLDDFVPFMTDNPGIFAKYLVLVAIALEESRNSGEDRAFHWWEM